MPNYVRANQPGGTFFITIVTYNRRRFLTHPDSIALLETTYQQTVQSYRFALHAFCILPDHIHALITLPHSDHDFPKRCRFFKSAFTRAHLRQNPPDKPQNVSRLRKGEAAIWQRRFWEHTIRNEEDFERHFDYIHFNPVKHELVDAPGAWPHSSYQRYAKRGWYEQDWGEAEPRTLRGMTHTGE